MPEKLMSCVKKVMKQGKTRSEAYAICVKSTGQKPHKKKDADLTTPEQKELSKMLLQHNLDICEGCNKIVDLEDCTQTEKEIKIICQECGKETAVLR